MKILSRSYAFNKTAKTVTFSDYPTIRLEQIMLIVNTTANVIIYNPGNSSLKGTLAGNVLTLNYDTSAMSNTDALQVWLDVPAVNTIPVPTENDFGIITNAKPAQIDRISFAKTLASGVDSDWGSMIGALGSGQTVSQSGGNLVMTSGTTANSETIIRSNKSYKGGLRFRSKVTLSQRIANQSFFVEMVDVIGDALAVTINSATQVTVTMPSGHPFDSTSVGQSVYIGNYSGTGTFVSGRYAIASVSGNTVVFTVAGFAAGSGTCSVFGWNYYQILYDGTTNTNNKFDTQRRGWNQGFTTVNINASASPGHVNVISANDASCSYSDSVGNNTTSGATRQGIKTSRDENVPDDYNLFVQIRVVNGAAAPASTTTLTVGLITVQNYAAQDVVIQDTRAPTYGAALPVNVATGTLNSNSAAKYVWWTDSTTALAANATFTGATRDITTSTSGTTAANMGQELRVSAISDVAGTLYLEVSIDGTTWRRVKSIALTQATGTGMAFYGEIIHRPGQRYARVVFINGATAQTYVSLNTMALAA